MINALSIYKEANQRFIVIRTSRGFGVRHNVLERVCQLDFTFSISAWFGNLTVANRYTITK